MAKTILAGEQIKKLSFQQCFSFFTFFAQYSRGSLNTSSCVTVQAMQAMGIASIKRKAICCDIVMSLPLVVYGLNMQSFPVQNSCHYCWGESVC